MEWSLLAAALLLILLFNTNQSCDISNLISFIPDIRTCNNSILTISFNFTNATCASYEYQIELIHLHTQEIKRSTQNPKPFLYNGTNICHISLTLTDNVTAEEYYNSSLHIRVDKYPSCFLSNNFTVLVDKDPPGSFLIHSAVYCNEVYLFWSTPLSPPACPIKSYEIKFNDTTIITNKTYHHFTELPANQSMSVSVGVTNDIGTSWNSTLITTAIAPVVSMVNHTVELIQINSTSLTACLSITAKVFTHCLYSLPTHINLSLSCDDTYYPTITSSILSVNGLIEYNYKGIPVDMLHCTAKAMWYNLNSSTTEYTFTFNTSQLYMKIFPVSNSLHYTCYYREHSIVWGCGISVNNNASNTTQRNGKNVTQGYLTGLCPGTSYNVTYYTLSSKGSKYVMGSMNVSVNGSICNHPTSPGGATSKNHIMTYVAVFVFVPVGVIIALVCIIIIVWFVKNCKVTRNVSLVQASEKDTKNENLATRYTKNDEKVTFDGTNNERAKDFSTDGSEPAQPPSPSQLAILSSENESNSAESGLEESDGLGQSQYPEPSENESNSAESELKESSKSGGSQYATPVIETLNQAPNSESKSESDSVASEHVVNEFVIGTTGEPPKRRGSTDSNISISSVISKASGLVEGAMNIATSSLEKVTSSVKFSKDPKYKPLQQHEHDLSTIPSAGLDDDDQMPESNN